MDFVVFPKPGAKGEAGARVSPHQRPGASAAPFAPGLVGGFGRSHRLRRRERSIAPPRITDAREVGSGTAEAMKVEKSAVRVAQLISPKLVLFVPSMATPVMTYWPVPVSNWKTGCGGVAVGDVAFVVPHVGATQRTARAVGLVEVPGDHALRGGHRACRPAR